MDYDQLPQLIRHPGHHHDLTLLRHPAYPQGHFLCNACHGQGSGFCYHCSVCSFDIHITCACIQDSLNHPAHHHFLTLIFSPTYQNKHFTCNICRKVGYNHWLYRCVDCGGFDAHLNCARGAPAPLLLNQYSQRPRQMLQPAVAPLQHNVTYVQQPLGFQHNYATNYSANRPISGVLQAIQQPVSATTPGNYWLNVSLTGLVYGAAQQVGQSLVQAIIPEDGGSGSGGDGGGADGGSGGGEF